MGLLSPLTSILRIASRVPLQVNSDGDANGCTKVIAEGQWARRIPNAGNEPTQGHGRHDSRTRPDTAPKNARPGNVARHRSGPLFRHGREPEILCDPQMV